VCSHCKLYMSLRIFSNYLGKSSLVCKLGAGQAEWKFGSGIWN